MSTDQIAQIEVLDPAPRKPRAVLVPLPAMPRGVRLKTLGQVRRELASVYSDVKRGLLDSQEGSRRTYILSQIGRVIEAAEIERRIEGLEASRQEVL